jgi:hypothetical protein
MFLSNIEFKILWPIFNYLRAKVVLLNLWASIKFLSNSTIDLYFFNIVRSLNGGSFITGSLIF